MKLFDFSQYVTLLKVFSRTQFFSGDERRKKRKKIFVEADKNKSNIKKGATFFLILIPVAILLALIVGVAYSMTEIGISSGNIALLPNYFICLSQILTLFLGLGALVNVIYFSSDNMLLQSLPISNMTIFAAKFTVVYMSQLLVSTFLLIPSLLTVGIKLALSGVHISVGYYFFAVFTPFVAPLIPLLAITLISIPLMYLLSFIKNRNFAKNLLSSIEALGFFAIYLLFASFNLFSTGESEAPIEAIALMNALGRFGVYNTNWINAMLGKDIALNAFLYLLYVAVAFIAILFLSLWHYKRAITLSLEDGGARKKKRIRADNASPKGGVVSSLAVKDLKNMFSEPNLVTQFILGLIIIPVIGLFFKFSGFDKMLEIENGAADLCLLGMASYIASIMISATNYISVVGISLEGKSFGLLKSLPITVKDIVKSKIIVSNIYNAIISLEMFIVFAIISSARLGPLYSFINAIMIFVFGFGMSCLELFFDMKKPNLQWENFQKLIRNNTRALKPMLFAVGFGIFYLAAGFVSGMFFGKNLSIAYFVYFAVFALTSAIFAAVTFSLLWKNKEELFDEIEA